MKTIKIVAALLICVAFIGSETFAQKFKIDTESSSVMWTGYKIGGQHNGDLMLKSGKLFAKEDGINGTFIIDMTTINTTDLEGEMKGKLDGHLSAPDFFNVEEHPTAKFKLTKMTPVRVKEGSDATHKVTGELIIKDITHTVQFPAKVVIDGDNMTANAKLSIDRTMWAIEYGTAGNVLATLKDKVIYDDVDLELNLSAKVDDTLVEEVVEGTKKMAGKIGDGVKKAAEGVKDAAEKVGDKMKKDDDGDDNEEDKNDK